MYFFFLKQWKKDTYFRGNKKGRPLLQLEKRSTGEQGMPKMEISISGIKLWWVGVEIESI